MFARIQGVLFAYVYFSGRRCAVTLKVGRGGREGARLIGHGDLMCVGGGGWLKILLPSNYHRFYVRNRTEVCRLNYGKDDFR